MDLAELHRERAKYLATAAAMLSGLVKEELSVPAPRVRVIGRRGKMAGVAYYRATTRAVKNAPPRKLSGRFRAGVAWEINAEGTKARVGTNDVRARRFEKGHPPGENLHQFLQTVLERNRERLARVLLGGAP